MGTLIVKNSQSPKGIKCLSVASVFKNDQVQVHKDPCSRFNVCFRPLNSDLILLHDDPISIAFAISSCHNEKLAYRAKVLQWCSFSASEVEPFATGLKVEAKQKTRDSNFRQKQRKQRLQSSLDLINTSLKDKQFLVGSEICLADISLAVDLLPALENGCLLETKHQNVLSWHKRVSGMCGGCFGTPTTAGGGNPKKALLPKILCLHGYRQNDKLFREKLGAFRKSVSKLADLVFINAPHELIDEDDGQIQRGWWFSQSHKYFKADDVSDCDMGLEESFDVVLSTIKSQGPFDGVMGFSQGAALATMLCLKHPAHFKFCMLFAAFRSRCSKHQPWYDGSLKVDMPTLYVMGDDDKVIPKSMSEEIMPLFNNATVVAHPGGHFVPASGEVKLKYMQFLKNFH